MMHKHKEKTFLLPLLLLWFVLLGVGLPLSHLEWHGYWFNIGWVQICSLVICALTIYFIRRKRGRISHSEWLWFALPYILSLFLVWNIRATVGTALSSPTRSILMTYVIYSNLYVADIFLWIIGFPYEEIWGPDDEKDRRVWRAVLVLASLAVVAFALQRSIEIANHFSSLADSSGIEALQAWMHRVTFTVYVVLTGRVLLPRILRAIAPASTAEFASPS